MAFPRLILVLTLTLFLSACIGGGRREARPAPRPAPKPAATAQASPGGTPGFTTAAARQCLVDLGQQQVRYEILPNRFFGGGCRAIDSVKLLDTGLPTTNLGAMTCPLARTFAAWSRYAVQPAAVQILGSQAVRIETYGTYACRNIVGGASGKLSQHAHANAVDVAAIILKDGRRISLLGSWHGGTADEKRFLRVIRASACKRFGTVLSPDYNAAHANHFHLDMDGKPGAFCR